MTWHRDYDEDREDRAAFTIRCADCDCEYDNRQNGCPDCGSSSCSYDSDDARRWNDYSERCGRYSL